MAKQPNDDLFEGTKMTFGEHLDELRTSLIRALLGLVCGTLLGLLCASYVVQFVQEPLKRALGNYYVTKAKTDMAALNNGTAPAEMVRLLENELLIRDVLKVEPAVLVHSLRTTDARFADIDVRPFRFVSADIKDGEVTKLCASLFEDGEAEERTPGKKMWELLDDDQQELVQRLAGESSASETDQAAVVAMLNDLAENEKLYASKELKGVDGSKPASITSWLPWTPKASVSEASYAETVETIRIELAEGKEVSSDQKRRLNKLLISDVYSEHIRRPQINVVELPLWKPASVRVLALNPQEVFMIWIKAAFITGTVIASPWIFWQIWHFVASGLYPHEKRYVYIYLPFSLGLFLAGAALAFFFVFEPVLTFLFSFNAMMEIDPDPRISEWLSFVLLLPLGFGIAFQLPLVMLFINRIGIIEIQVYVQKWRIAILAIFVISMFLTPADPISMLLMAVPLTVLYFLGVALCKWMPRGRNPFSEAYEP